MSGRDSNSPKTVVLTAEDADKAERIGDCGLSPHLPGRDCLVFSLETDFVPPRAHPDRRLSEVSAVMAYVLRLQGAGLGVLRGR